MAVQAWPFNSESQSPRGWGAPEWRMFMTRMRQQGVIADYESELLVEPVSGELQSVVRPGMAFVAGHQVLIDADETVDHDTADLEDDRVDLVVLTTDWTIDERRAYVEVLTGTAAADPSAPSPTQDEVGDPEGLWQEPLAEVLIESAAGETGGHTDLRAFMEVPGRLLVVDDESELDAIDPTFHRFAVVAPGTETGSVRWYNPDTGSWETVIAGDFATESYVDTAIDNATTKSAIDALGVDADTVDGKDASAFVESIDVDTIEVVTEGNAGSTTGVLYIEMPA